MKIAFIIIVDNIEAYIDYQDPYIHDLFIYIPKVQNPKIHQDNSIVLHIGIEKENITIKEIEEIKILESKIKELIIKGQSLGFSNYYIKELIEDDFPNNILINLRFMEDIKINRLRQKMVEL